MVRLKIAEAFTEGRGDAHGCAARAALQGRFIRPSPISLEQTLRTKLPGAILDSARAGPEGVSPRDGANNSRSDDFLAGSPGRQGSGGELPWHVHRYCGDRVARNVK